VWVDGQAVAGEGNLVSTSAAGDPTHVQVDWIVQFDAGTGFWSYYYQVEAITPGHDVTSFSITFLQSNPFFGIGTLPGDLDNLAGNLDPITGEIVPGHTGTTAGGTFANLSPPGLFDTPPSGVIVQESGVPNAVVTPSLFSIGTTSPTATARWSFVTPGSPLPNGGESAILVVRSLFPPTYGNASAINGDPQSPWSTNSAINGGERQVPIPSPEPTSLALLGLLGLPFAGRMGVRMTRNWLRKAPSA
jgi:hypothetical protein